MAGCLRGLVGLVAIIFLIGVVGALYGGTASRQAALPKPDLTSPNKTKVRELEDPAPVILRPTWQDATQKSKIDDSTNVWLILKSNDNVPGRFISGAPAELTIRCMENKTAVFFQFADQFLSDIQGYGNITYRIDTKAAQKRGFSVSTDNEALGLWNGGTAIPFAKSMFDGETMFVRVTPFNESPVEAEFNIKGLASAIAPLRKACGW